MRKMLKGMMIMMVLASMVLLPLAAGGQQEAASSAENWPSGPLTAYVPAKPGGNMDVKIRIIGKYLEEILDTNLVVNNVPGGGGAIELTQFLAEAPNSDAICYSVCAQLAVVPLFGNIEYSMDDYEIVAGTDTVQIGLFVDSKLGVNTLEELQEYAKGKTIKFSATGVNSSPYIYTKHLMNEMGIESDVIVDKGFPTALVNIASGVCEVAACALNLAESYVEDGSIIPLGVFNEKPYTGFAEEGYASVPTIREQGYDILWDSMSYIMMRAGTDQAILDKLSGALEQVFTDPEFKKEFAAAGYLQLEDNSAEWATDMIAYKIEQGKEYFNSVQQ